MGIGVARDLGVSWTREQFLWNLLPTFDPGRFHSIGTDQNLAPGFDRGGTAQLFPGQLQWWLGQESSLRRPGRGQPVHRGAGEGKRRQSWLLGALQRAGYLQSRNPGFAWDSPNRVSDYLKYAQAAYAAIKANSSAKVILGSLGIIASQCQNGGDEMTFWNGLMSLLGNTPVPADEVSLNIHKEPEKIYDLVELYH